MLASQVWAVVWAGRWNVWFNDTVDCWLGVVRDGSRTRLDVKMLFVGSCMGAGLIVL